MIEFFIAITIGLAFATSDVEYPKEEPLITYQWNDKPTMGMHIEPLTNDIYVVDIDG